MAFPESFPSESGWGKKTVGLIYLSSVPWMADDAGGTCADRMPVKSTPEGVGFEARLHCMDARYGVRGVDIKVTPDSHRAVSRHIADLCIAFGSLGGGHIRTRSD